MQFVQSRQGRRTGPGRGGRLWLINVMLGRACFAPVPGCTGTISRATARDGDGDGVGVINRERVKRPSGIVANGKYGNALSVICANYVPPTPMPDQGCEPRVANEFARRGSIFGMFARANGQRSQRKSPTST